MDNPRRSHLDADDNTADTLLHSSGGSERRPAIHALSLPDLCDDQHFIQKSHRNASRHRYPPKSNTAYPKREYIRTQQGSSSTSSDQLAMRAQWEPEQWGAHAEKEKAKDKQRKINCRSQQCEGRETFGADTQDTRYSYHHGNTEKGWNMPDDSEQALSPHQPPQPRSDRKEPNVNMPQEHSFSLVVKKGLLKNQEEEITNMKTDSALPAELTTEMSSSCPSHKSRPQEQTNDKNVMEQPASCDVSSTENHEDLEKETNSTQKSNNQGIIGNILETKSSSPSNSDNHEFGRLTALVKHIDTKLKMLTSTLQHQNMNNMSIHFENEIPHQSAVIPTVSKAENLPHSSIDGNKASDMEGITHEIEEKVTPANVSEDMIDNNLLVFVNIPENCKEIELLCHLEKFGSVLYIHISETCAIVLYSDEQIAQKAFASRHIFGKNKLQVYRVAKPSVKLYLGSLPPDATNDNILESISQYGLVLNLKRTFDTCNQPQNFCFVTVEEPVARTLIDIEKVIIKNKIICVEMSHEQREQETIQDSAQASFCVQFMNLPLDATYTDVREQVSKYGRILKLYVSGQCGKVSFYTQKAQEALLSSPFSVLGQVVTVMKVDILKTDLHIGGFRASTTNITLFEELSRYGTIGKFVRPTRNDGEVPTNYCFISFAEEEVAERLLEAGYVSVNGRKATVNLKLKKTVATNRNKLFF